MLPDHNTVRFDPISKRLVALPEGWESFPGFEPQDSLPRNDSGPYVPIAAQHEIEAATQEAESRGELLPRTELLRYEQMRSLLHAFANEAHSTSIGGSISPSIRRCKVVGSNPERIISALSEHSLQLSETEASSWRLQAIVDAASEREVDEIERAFADSVSLEGSPLQREALLYLPDGKFRLYCGVNGMDRSTHEFPVLEQAAQIPDYHLLGLQDLTQKIQIIQLTTSNFDSLKVSERLQLVMLLQKVNPFITYSNLFELCVPPHETFIALRPSVSEELPGLVVGCLVLETDAAGITEVASWVTAQGEFRFPGTGTVLLEEGLSYFHKNYPGHGLFSELNIQLAARLAHKAGLSCDRGTLEDHYPINFRLATFSVRQHPFLS